MSVLSVHSERPFGRFIPLPAFRLKITANGLIWTISSKDERHFVGIVRLFSARVWQMAKNIVICCDGTGNEFGAQIAYYHPGVGTMGARNALSRIGKWWTRIIGLAFGYG